MQLEAIAAELNIFLAEKSSRSKRVGLVVEVRKTIAAEAAFSAGPLALGARPVPLEVLTALRAAARDDNPRVALEALYAFGALAVEAAGRRAPRAARRHRCPISRRCWVPRIRGDALRGGARDRPRLFARTRRTTPIDGASATR